MLKDCCGLEKNSKYFLGGHTKSRLHYQVEGRKEFVEKKMRGIHWEWVTECEVPDGDKSATVEKRKPHKRKDRPEDDALKELEARLQLGARLMRIEDRLPSEYKSLMTRVSEYEIILSKLEDLEEVESQEESRSTSSSDRRGSADLCGEPEACREEASVSTGVQADVVGTSRVKSSGPHSELRGRRNTRLDECRCSIGWDGCRAAAISICLGQPLGLR